MRSVKTLSLVVLAVCAVVALGGAGAASATNLCMVQGVGSPRTCPAGQSFGLPHTGGMTISGRAVLNTSGGTLNPVITCSASSMTIVMDGVVASGTPLVSSRITALSYSACTSVPAGCSSTATVTGLPTTESINWMFNTDAATFGGTYPKVTFRCPVGGGSTVTCDFGGSSVNGILNGGAPATINYLNSTIAVSGFGCPTSATVSQNYTMTSPPSLWPTNT